MGVFRTDLGNQAASKKSQVVQLPPTAPPLMASVSVGDVLPEAGSMIFVELSSLTGTAYKQLQIAMRSVCMMYKTSFQRLLEDTEQSGEDFGVLYTCWDLRPTV